MAEINPRPIDAESFQLNNLELNSEPLSVEVLNQIRETSPDFIDSAKKALDLARDKSANVIFYAHDKRGITFPFELTVNGEISRLPFVHALTTRPGERSNVVNNLKQIIESRGFMARSPYVNARIHSQEVDLAQITRQNEFAASSSESQTSGDRYVLKLWQAHKEIDDLTEQPVPDSTVGMKMRAVGDVAEDVRVDFTPIQKTSLLVVFPAELSAEEKKQRIAYYEEELKALRTDLQIEFS